MTWIYATGLLVLAAPFVLWPLIRRPEAAPEAGDRPARPDPGLAAEERELDEA